MKRKPPPQLHKPNKSICSVCGADTQLFRTHVIPRFLQKSGDLDNLILVCATCQANFREVDFVAYLASIMKAHPDFRNVAFEPLLGATTRYRADITAHRRSRSGVEHLVIECKKLSTMEISDVSIVGEQLRKYIELIPGIRGVLAFPGRASAATTHELSELGIEVWDIDYIAEKFKQQIAKAEDKYFKALFTGTRARATQDLLIAELRSCKRGPRDWPVYQKLVGRIIEQLFCPGLNSPIPQHSNASGTNRPDFILSNYAIDGFWHHIRTRYFADYIIVDPKNHTGPINKTEVLKVANYLKPQGAGLFGIIICRAGADSGALTTRREQWTESNKLILILDDSDIESMLLAQSAGGDPCSVLSDRLRDFRLSF